MALKTTCRIFESFCQIRSVVKTSLIANKLECLSLKIASKLVLHVQLGLPFPIIGKINKLPVRVTKLTTTPPPPDFAHLKAHVLFLGSVIYFVADTSRFYKFVFGKLFYPNWLIWRFLLFVANNPMFYIAKVK